MKRSFLTLIVLSLCLVVSANADNINPAPAFNANISIAPNFHSHSSFVTAPEPATIVIMLFGGLLLINRKKFSSFIHHH